MYSKEESFDYQILALSEKFYADYPNPPYKEILQKNNRPYNCLLLQSHYGYFICIPYRSHIKHKYAYKFKNSLRSQRTSSGLDYSKMVIITNNEYIETGNAIINQDEYRETREHIAYIKNDAQKYIDTYIDGLSNNKANLDQKEFYRTYQYSTLPYFHKELGIIE